MAEKILVLVSCPEPVAESIAKPIVEEKLAACVSIVGKAKSLYIWEDELCQEEECLLFIKSTYQNWDNLEKRIKALHPYEVPEIIAFDIERGHGPYLDWLSDSLGKT